MADIVHIITVGTSLLDNSGGNLENGKNKNEINKLNNLCINAKTLLSSNRNCKVLNTQKDAIVKLFLPLDPQTQINYRPSKTNTPADRLPQEVSYLTIKAKEDSPGTGNGNGTAACYLISSDSQPGMLCAGVIKEYVNSQEYLKKHYEVKEIIIAQGVDTEKPEEFENSGFRNLIDEINKIIDSKCADADRIYINITGGFKGIVPYSTLTGILRASDRITLCYLFEDSTKIIEMPRYPIGIDFHLWHRNAARLKMVTEGLDVNNAFYERLSEPVRNLLFTDDHGVKTLFSLGKTLRDQYHSLLQKDPLKVYSKEIVDILMQDDSGLKSILNSIIDSVGDLIWTGDKIPEMVEHAQRHHHNLLVFAEMFLTPILEVDPEFLTTEEIFCLLAGILLHDCGHSLNYITTVDGKKVPLFSSEIREYHHYLSYQRLYDKETAVELNWPHPECSPNVLDPKLHMAVLTVCLYHRKKMCYTNEHKDRYTVCFINAEYDSLTKYIKDQKAFLPEKEKFDLMKVVAFMRLIDSWDNQARRAGRKEVIDHVLKLMNRDKEIALEKAKTCKQLLDELYYSTKEYNGIKGLYELIEQNGDSIKLKEGYIEGHVFCHELLNNNANDKIIKTFARAWLVAAESIDNANMKDKQKIHYEKHLHIKEVFVVPDNTISKFNKENKNFKIVFVENDEWAEVLDEEGKYPELKELMRKLLGKVSSPSVTMRNFIEKVEVIPEYEPLKDYIKKMYHINLTYCWRTKEGAEQIFDS